MQWGHVAFAAGLGLLFGVVLLVGSLRGVSLPPPGEGEGYVELFSPPQDTFEVLLLAGDGQAYAAIARDPSLSRPEAFRSGASHEAYFAQRPVVPYLLWGLSAGQAGLHPIVFIAIEALAGGLFVGACALWLERRARGLDSRLAALVLLLPCVQTSYFFSTDLLGMGLAVGGYLLWTDRRPRPGWAAVCFVLAALTRETTLLIPLVLGLELLWRRRLDLRSAVLLGLAPVTFAAWHLVVRLRLGAPAGGHNFAAPFAGIVAAAPTWDVADVAMAALLVVGLAVSLIWCRRDPAVWLVVAFGLLGTVLSERVWELWPNFSRVLLPVYFVPMLMVLSARRAVASVPAGKAVR